MLTVTSASHHAPEKGVVRSRESFKFRWAPTISLERLIVSGAVNLVGRPVCSPSQFITLTDDICVQHGGPEVLRRAGLSAAAVTC